MQNKFIKVSICAFISMCILALMFGCGGNDNGQEVDPENQSNDPQDTMKIALLLPGAISDGGWNASAYEGLMELKDEGYEVSFTESVPVPNIEEIFRNYAEQDYDLIIGHGFEFGDPALRVAPNFPESNFFVSGKTPPNAQIEPNVGFIDQKEYEGAYLAGVLAGLMTETNKIGYVGGMEIPPQLANLAAFTKGAQSVNEEVEILGVITGTFEDPAKGKEAAIAQIDNGADIICQTADSTGMGAIEAAKEKGVYLIGYGGDQYEMAPDLMLTSIIVSIPIAIEMQVERIKDGTFGGVWIAGIAEGITDIAPYHNLEDKIPEEVKQKVMEVREQIISGEFEVPEIYERIDSKLQ
ncbi:MAG: hypothetical protein APF76_00575 [Desulfitibacter sp. BRH_c19]|nr:MAG: hypothetical protein APF76_00575 [Desulfitibacter sp. BRH_c19]